MLKRHQEAVEGRPSVAPRVVSGPKEQNPEERGEHELLHLAPAPWCEACVRRNDIGKPHLRITFEVKDAGATRVLLDFAFLKANGGWTELGDPEQPAAEIFATTLMMLDEDTKTFPAILMPTTAVSEYATANVLDFLESLIWKR